MLIQTNGETRRAFLLGLFLLGLPLSLIQSQKQNNPFESLEFNIQSINNINRDKIHKYWTPKSGFSCFISTSFYFGYVQSGLQLLPFDGKKSDYPDFSFSYIYAGWGYELKISRSLDLYFGLTTGSTVMFFQEANRESAYEQELSMGIDCSLAFSFKPEMAVTFSLNDRLIYTYHPIRITCFSIGLTCTIKTPGWIKIILE